MHVLDLCAGSGSATQAFKDRGHDVVTVDICGDVDIIADVRTYQPTQYFDFIWSSPPCTEFSKANYRLGKCKDRKPDLSLVKACFQIIDYAQPKYWILENPMACLRHFIGKPAITVHYSDYGYPTRKPTDIWGVFPWFWSTKHNSDLARFDLLPKSARAKLPYELSLAICKAIENAL